MFRQIVSATVLAAFSLSPNEVMSFPFFYATLDPSDESNLILVAQKSKRKKKKKRMSYGEAIDLCRRKYGRNNVVRVKIQANGQVVCYVDMYSPSDNTRQNFNK